jgi:hypothetical protein
MFLTKDQVDLLNYQQCQQHLSALTTQYDIDRPLAEQFKEVWPVLDQICDTLLYLEDRIARFEDPRIPSMDMLA